MNDSWFDEYTFEIAARRSYLPTELRDALKTKGGLLLRFRLGDQGRVGRLCLLQLALLVRDHALGFELRVLGAPCLLRRHNVRVGLRLRRRLSAARFCDFRLHDLYVQRVEREAKIGELARARLAYDHSERIVVVLHSLERNTAHMRHRRWLCRRQRDRRALSRTDAEGGRLATWIERSGFG